VISNAKALEDALPNLRTFDDDNEKERLRRVSDTYTAFFNAAEFLKKDDKATAGVNKKKILQGLDFLKKKLFIRGESERLENDVAAAGPNADEVGSTQPHVALLLEAIGSCASSQSETKSSPSKSHVRAAAIMPQTKLRPRRTQDFILQKETKHRLCFREEILFVPVEVKTGENGGKGPVALLNSALDQVLAALAKACYVGYAFFKYGVPSHATGVIMNMAVVEVVHMKCVGIGTPQVKVELYRSGYLPLMTCPMFDKWVVGCAKKMYGEDYAGIRKSLYGDEGTGGMTDGIPLGMTTLLNLMRQQGKVLYGMAVDTTGDLLGGVLGFGATSVVFKGKNDGGSGYAIKVARSNELASEIRREMEVLRELGRHDNIPTVHDEETSKNVTVNFGCVTMKELPALFTAPVGIDPVLYLSRNGVVRRNVIRILQDGIVSALKFMHSRSYCHCDISPRNIVLAEYVGGVQPRAILIDFATARKVDQDVSGFVGTPNYVHRDLFEWFLRRRKYKPQPSHDLAALGFTLAYFINSCRRSWRVGRYPLSMTGSDSKEEEEHLRSTMDARLAAARLASKEYQTVNQLLANDDPTRMLPPNESSTKVQQGGMSID
jgi:RIO-like serine/threonine protein kinase